MLGSVSPDGPASTGGLLRQDLVVALDGRPVTGVDDLIRLLDADRHRPGGDHRRAPPRPAALVHRDAGRAEEGGVGAHPSRFRFWRVCVIVRGKTDVGEDAMNDMTRALECLTPGQVEAYRRDGYLVLEGRVPLDVIAECHAEIDRIRNEARQLTAHTDQIDLEDSHTRDDPRIRRIKLPHKQSQVFDDLMRSDAILAPVRDLIGPNLRLQNSKLNMKSARYGAPVDWHQDWAFYPYTNDDILAVGVFLDDVTEENGPLMVLPWHAIAGRPMTITPAATSPERCRSPRPGSTRRTRSAPWRRQGSISIHHVRTVHGSDLNRSDRDRAVLFYEIAAADAFPIAGSMGMFPSLAEFDARMLCGTEHDRAARDQRAGAHPAAAAADARLDLRDPEAERRPGIRARAAEGDVAAASKGEGPEHDAPGLPKRSAPGLLVVGGVVLGDEHGAGVDHRVDRLALLDLQRVLDAEAAHVHRVLGDRGGHVAGEDRLGGVGVGVEADDHDLGRACWPT